MKVKELIEELRKCNEDSEVVVAVCGPDGYGSQEKLKRIIAMADNADSVEEFDETVVIWR